MAEQNVVSLLKQAAVDTEMKSYFAGDHMDSSCARAAFGALWQAGYDAALSAAHPVQLSDLSFDLLTRLRNAMTKLGIATDESMEGFGARIESHLYALCSQIDRLCASLQSHPVVGVGAQEPDDKPVNTEPIIRNGKIIGHRLNAPIRYWESKASSQEAQISDEDIIASAERHLSIVFNGSEVIAAFRALLAKGHASDCGVKR